MTPSRMSISKRRPHSVQLYSKRGMRAV
jgi:hypothetical protein